MQIQKYNPICPDLSSIANNPSGFKTIDKLSPSLYIYVHIYKEREREREREITFSPWNIPTNH